MPADEAFRAGLVNVGGEGQLVAGGIAAAEGGTRGLAFASGLAAEDAVLRALPHRQFPGAEAGVDGQVERFRGRRLDESLPRCRRSGRCGSK